MISLAKHSVLSFHLYSGNRFSISFITKCILAQRLRIASSVNGTYCPRCVAIFPIGEKHVQNASNRKFRGTIAYKPLPIISFLTVWLNGVIDHLKRPLCAIPTVHDHDLCHRFSSAYELTFWTSELHLINSFSEPPSDSPWNLSSPRIFRLSRTYFSKSFESRCGKLSQFR